MPWNATPLGEIYTLTTIGLIGSTKHIFKQRSFDSLKIALKPNKKPGQLPNLIFEMLEMEAFYNTMHRCNLHL